MFPQYNCHPQDKILQFILFWFLDMTPCAFLNSHTLLINQTRGRIQEDTWTIQLVAFSTVRISHDILTLLRLGLIASLSPKVRIVYVSAVQSLQWRGLEAEDFWTGGCSGSPAFSSFHIGVGDIFNDQSMGGLTFYTITQARRKCLDNILGFQFIINISTIICLVSSQITRLSSAALETHLYVYSA